MKITVITVAYNASDTIEDAIKSVKTQSHQNIEYIIIDGASTDDTLRIINKYSSIVSQIVSEPDDGIYHAMNKGLSLATGDIVGFLNADDIYYDDHVLSRVLEAMEDTNIDAVYGDLVYVDKLNTNKIVRYWKSSDYKEGLFKSGWMPAHPTFYVRREIYKLYGDFDLEYLIQSDFELTMRLIEVNRIRTKYIPGVMVRMRMGGVTNNSISNVLRGNFEAYSACRKNGLDVSYLFIVKKILSRIPQYFHPFRVE